MKDSLLTDYISVKKEGENMTVITMNHPVKRDVTITEKRNDSAHYEILS